MAEACKRKFFTEGGKKKKRKKKAAARILNCCMILKASARSWLGIVDTSGTRGRPPAVLATRLELELGG